MISDSKVTPHSKFAPPNQGYFNGAHGPHIPLGGIPPNRPSSSGPVKKYPSNNKFTHLQGNGKRGKPVRGQATAYSNRDEVFAPAPNSGKAYQQFLFCRSLLDTTFEFSGSYSFISQGPNAVKTRDPPGILLGGNHFSINQPNSHIEFINRFPQSQIQNDNAYQTFNNPVTAYVFPKQQHQTNDIHFNYKNQNDEYTRNLVPPPQPYKPFQDKDTVKNKNSKPKEQNGATQSSNQHTQFIKNNVPQNIALQLPPPFEQNKFNYAQNEVKNDQAVEVEVTKQKLKVFHNSIPTNYNPLTPDYVDYDFHAIKRPTSLPKLQTYEVTEGKQWQESPPFHYRFPEPPHLTQRPKKPSGSRRPPPPEQPIIELSRPILELSLPPFLPTPYKPEGVVPTSSTQEEVSTIFSQLSNKIKTHEYQTAHPHFFDVKEVSTHFPILGRPETKPELQTEFNPYKEQESTNEITTNGGEDEEKTTTTLRTINRDPTKVRITHRRRRPSNRLRTTTTEESVTTENYDVQKTQENETELSTETERPLRRRPIRYRTTTVADIPEVEEPTTKSTRGRNRFRQRQNPTDALRNSGYRKRLRPTDMPSNHKITQGDLNQNDYKKTTEEISVESYSSSTEENSESFDSSFVKDTDTTEEDIQVKQNRYEYDFDNRRHPTQLDELSKYHITSAHNDLELTKPNKDADIDVTERHTTEIIPTTNIPIPENEIDFSTPEPQRTQTIVATEQPEIEEITIATTIPSTTTTTTEETTTTKSHRVRGRPVKYDVSNRPRFSVKDYRQRFTTTSSTTESYRTTSASSRLRFPNRSRRPTTSTTTVNSVLPEDDEEQNSEPMRTKFKPKEPRFSVTTEANENIITEKNIKSVNTRLRPFGRQRSTTEATTPKVSIKPNLFSQRRRTAPLSLKSRIQNKYNKTQETTTTESELENETEQVFQTTISYDSNTPELTTEYAIRKYSKPEQSTEYLETTTDILKNDPLLYSQRVSDLTSSFKNEYDTPGLFKNVSPTSRRIPNHFTIATDDPRLPIEAFFPNINDNKEK